MLKFPDILICTNQLIYTDNCYKDIFKTKKKPRSISKEIQVLMKSNPLRNDKLINN